MSATGHKGVDVRESANRLLFRALLQDSTGALVTAGTTSLYLYQIEHDGTLKSYDWNDSTFKTTALTTETQALTHRTGNNGTTNTGLWTYALTTLTGFTVGAVYLARVKNTGAAPTDQVREFQFGSAQGDLVVTSAYYLKGDIAATEDGVIREATFADNAISDRTVAADMDSYWAKIEHEKSQTDAVERYTATWMKNDHPCADAITSPTIKVTKVADGTTLIASTAMAAVSGETGVYRYVEGTNLITRGQQYTVTVTATINGSTRTDKRVIWRDRG